MSAGTAGTAGALDAQESAIDEWWSLVDQQVATAASGAPVDAGAFATARRDEMNEFRSANHAYQDALGRVHMSALDDATRAAIVGILGTGLAFLLLGHVLVLRADHRNARRAALDAEFTERMLFAQSGDEARGLLTDHIEALLPGSKVEVLDADRDERAAGCTAYAEGDFRTEKDRGSCTTCTVLGRRTLCAPLRVGSSTFGSVAVGLPKRGLPEERTMVQAVGHAAPVLANLRTLAIAEAHAATDVVTGLPNRRSVDDTLRTMAAQADRAARPLSVVMVDLDRFKAINDRWGHGKGDEVLATIAGVLRRSVRTADFVGRAGGEEFVLLLADTDHTGALVVAEKVRKAVARTRLPMIDRPVTASFGVAVFPRDCSDASELLDYADEAMYEAKQQGRNRVASYDPPVPSPEESLAR